MGDGASQILLRFWIAQKESFSTKKESGPDSPPALRYEAMKSAHKTLTGDETYGRSCRGVWRHCWGV